MSIVSDDIKDFITTALAQKLKSIKPVYGGGNNQIYRIILQDNNQYALKNYHVHDIKRDQMRLHREYNGFIFLHEYGEQQIPKAIAC
ncbi:MAG: hypothetical protein ACD_46C00210G0005, partial [uncultured bacterium]